jgi:(R,R)-butanediol dehydrogenase / meso-butanediol dehydrogenase / diacetyl reductase
MRQLSYLGQRRLVVEEVEPPPLASGQVRVRVDSVGICKSDIYGYSQVNDRRDVVLSEGDVLVMGHEPSGSIEELGLDVRGPAVGTPVAVNPIYGCGSCARCRSGDENLCDRRVVIGCMPAAPGACADLMTVPAEQVVPLDPSLPLELGALVEPLSVGAHGVRLAQLESRSSVLVIGGGIIGLGAALAARRRTDGEVLVLEPLAERRALCARLGLTAAAPDEVPPGELDVDVALDCVARPETLEAAINAVPTRGVVMVIGIWEDHIPLPVSTVVWRETRVCGSYGYTHSDFADVAEFLGSGEVDVSPVIGGRVGFDRVIAAFEGYADGSLNAVRTVLQPALGT